MWVCLKKILPLAVNKLNLKEPINKIKAFKIWNNYIKSRNFQYKISPVYFKNGILTVKCGNSIISSEFYLREKEILQEINKKERIISKLKFICQ